MTGLLSTDGCVCKEQEQEPEKGALNNTVKWRYMILAAIKAYPDTKGSIRIMQAIDQSSAFLKRSLFDYMADIILHGHQ